MEIDMTCRLFMQALRAQAEKKAEIVENPSWKRAYLSLADSVDHLDAMIARTEVHDSAIHPLATIALTEVQTKEKQP